MRCFVVSLFLLFGCLPVFAQESSVNINEIAETTEMVVPVVEKRLSLNEISDSLSQIETHIQTHSLSRKISQDYIKEINAYHDDLTKYKLQYTEELNNVSKKITSLSALTAEGETEPEEITAQREEFLKVSGEVKSRIAAVDLSLGKIDDINRTISKMRNQELMEQIMLKRESVLDMGEFWKSLTSFANFIYATTIYPFSWYQSLSFEQQEIVLKQVMIICFGAAMFIVLAGLMSWFIRQRWGYRADNLNPNYSQKVAAAFVTLFARGIMPSVLVGALWIWLRHHEAVFSGPLGVMLRVGALYLLYLFLSCATVFVFFTPYKPRWRLIEVDNRKAVSLSSALIFSIVIICLFSYFQVLALRLEYSDDIIFSLKLIANAVKAFCIILVSKRFLYDSRSLTDEELQKTLENTDDEYEIQGLSGSSKLSLFISFLTLVVFSFSLFGYILLTEYIFNRFILSVVIIGVAYVVQKLLLVLFRQFMGLRFWLRQFHVTKKQAAKAEFWFGFFLSPLIFCLCVFVLLAVWGVSVDILLQNTKKILMGFDVGGMHISIVSILMGIVSFFVVLFITSVIKNSFLSGKLSKIDMDVSVRNSLVAGIGFAGIVIAILVGISVMGGSLKGLALVAGALSLGAGLGLQNVVNNFVSGIILLFERPIKIGDWVVINGEEGTVKQVNIRATVLETWNRANIIIPNATILSTSLVNMTYQNKQARIDVQVGVDYNSDIDKVKEVLLDIASNTKNLLSKPAPFVAFLNLGESSLDFRLSCYTSDVFNKTSISNEIRESIIKRFKEEGIAIPFPHRVVYLNIEDKEKWDDVVNEKKKAKQEKKG